MNSNREIACGTYKGFWKNANAPDSPGRACCIWLHIDTGEYHFINPPKYFITLFGNNQYWLINCADTVYNANENGFDVYLKLPEGFTVEDLASNQQASFADFANQEEWGVYWFAIEFSNRAPLVNEALQATH